MLEIDKPGIPKLGDTMYIPVKIDHIVTTNKEGHEEVTCYGGYLKCCQPWDSKIQQVRVYFDEKYISKVGRKLGKRDETT